MVGVGPSTERWGWISLAVFVAAGVPWARHIWGFRKRPQQSKAFRKKQSSSAIGQTGEKNQGEGRKVPTIVVKSVAL